MPSTSILPAIQGLTSLTLEVSDPFSYGGRAAPQVTKNSCFIDTHLLLSSLSFAEIGICDSDKVLSITQWIGHPVEILDPTKEKSCCVFSLGDPRGKQIPCECDIMKGLPLADSASFYQGALKVEVLSILFSQLIMISTSIVSITKTPLALTFLGVQISNTGMDII